jgi:hypothetical protein
VHTCIVIEERTKEKEKKNREREKKKDVGRECMFPKSADVFETLKTSTSARQVQAQDKYKNKHKYKTPTTRCCSSTPAVLGLSPWGQLLKEQSNPEVPYTSSAYLLR